MGMGIKDGWLVFHSLSRHVALPIDRRKGYGYGIVDYGLNKLDVEVDHVNYHDRFEQVRLFDEDGNVIAHVTIENFTRKNWLLGELYGKNLHSSMNIDQYKKYALLAKGVVFTAEADGSTGVSVNRPAVDSPVDRIIDKGDCIYIATEMGSAVELLDPFARAGRTLDCAVFTFDGVGLFFDNGAAATFETSEYRISEYCEYSDPAPLGSTRRVQRSDGTDARRLFDAEGRKVVAIALAQPTNPLPVYVAALKEALVGSRVQNVSATDGGLCLHSDDDYDAVTNGALRVRIDSERVPFTVGDVFVNRGGTGLTLCICTQTESKPVVAFKIDQDALDRKEMTFNVI